MVGCLDATRFAEGVGIIVLSDHSRDSRWVEAEVSSLIYDRILETDGGQFLDAQLGDLLPMLAGAAQRGRLLVTSRVGRSVAGPPFPGRIDLVPPLDRRRAGAAGRA